MVILYYIYYKKSSLFLLRGTGKPQADYAAKA